MIFAPIRIECTYRGEFVYVSGFIGQVVAYGESCTGVRHFAPAHIPGNATWFPHRQMAWHVELEAGDLVLAPDGSRHLITRLVKHTAGGVMLPRDRWTIRTHLVRKDGKRDRRAIQTYDLCGEVLWPVMPEGADLVRQLRERLAAYDDRPTVAYDGQARIAARGGTWITLHHSR